MKMRVGDHVRYNSDHDPLRNRPLMKVVGEPFYDSSEVSVRLVDPGTGEPMGSPFWEYTDTLETTDRSVDPEVLKKMDRLKEKLDEVFVAVKKRIEHYEERAESFLRRGDQKALDQLQGLVKLAETELFLEREHR